jgi:hypothetical protein
LKFSFIFAFKGKWDLLDFRLQTNDGLVAVDLKIAAYIFLWFLAQCFLYILPIGGHREPGVILPSGDRLLYNTNGKV